MTISRRALLGAIAFTAAGAPGLPCLAAAPKAQRQVPGVFRQTVGEIEVTALLDGDLTLAPELFPDAKPGEMSLLAARGFQPLPVRSHTNAYAVNTGDRLYLVDTGTGSLLGPNLGHLPASLAAAGIALDQVDAILVTHMHPDHIGGLAKDGTALFPRAELILPEPDAAFWLSAEVMAKAPPDAQQYFRMAQNAAAPYAGRTRRIPSTGAVAPGIEALALPGHTPGHTGYLILSGNSRLLIWGDVVHNAALQFPRPDWTLTFDTDQPQAAATRRRTFDMATQDRVMIAGMHLPFPGLGHVIRDGERYHFQQVYWQVGP